MTTTRATLNCPNAAYYIAGQAGICPLGIAEPGTTKSSSLRAFSRAVERHFIPFFLDQQLPEDIGGFVAKGTIEHKGRSFEVMKRVHDERFVRCLFEPCVVLIDELTNAGHAQQASALQFINDGIERAFENTLALIRGDNNLNSWSTWIFAAANPVHLAAAGVDLSPPMVNRLCVLKWHPDTAAIRQGWANGFNFPAPTFPILPNDWRESCHKWGALLDRFAEYRPGLMQKVPNDPAQASQPYPTWRSWTNGGILLGAADSVNAHRDVAADLLYGCVGEGAGSEFFTWLSEQDLDDPEELLANPSSLNLSKRGDLKMATLANVLAAVRDDNTPERWEAARDVIEVAYSQSAEHATAAEGRLWKMKPAGYEPQVRTSSVAKAMQKHRLAEARR